MHAAGEAAHTIIVGAGIAGLACARRLLQLSKTASVLVLEAAEAVGGNVRSVAVALPEGNVAVDFGAFEIFDWYANVMGVVRELDLERELDELHLPPWLLRWDDDPDYKSFSPRRDVPLGEWPRLALLGAQLLAHPGWTRLYSAPAPVRAEPPSATIEELLASCPSMREYVRTFVESYLYGPITHVCAHEFIACLRVGLRGRGPLRCFRGTTARLSQGMLREARASGRARVQTGCRVVAVDQRARTVTYVDGGRTRTAVYDTLVLACPLDVTLRLLGVPRDECPVFYTRVVACCVRLDHVPNDVTWAAVLEQPSPAGSAQEHQLLSYTNVDRYLGVPGCIVAYVAVRGDALPTADEVLSLVDGVDFFALRGCRALELLHAEYFEHAMPVMSGDAYRWLEQASPCLASRGVLLAGAFSGPYPSMETACYSGRLAAETVSPAGE